MDEGARVRALLAEVAAHGANLEVRDDGMIEVVGADRVPEALWRRLSAAKPMLLERLTLRAACWDRPIRPAQLREALGSDLARIRSGAVCLPEVRAFVRARIERAQRDRGIVPARYAATTECAGCGPVPIFEGAPERVAACPWCRNRRLGLPMPAITGGKTGTTRPAQAGGRQ